MITNNTNTALFALRSYCYNMCRAPVGRVADLRTGGRWFDPRLGQYSFRGLIIVIATDSFSSFQNKPLLLRVCSTSLLKTLREKVKLLVTCCGPDFNYFCSSTTKIFNLLESILYNQLV